MKDIYRDFEVFSRALIVSKDVDPVYPMIKDIVKEYKFEPEWFAFVYVMFYSLESATKVCQKMSNRNAWDSRWFEANRKNGYISKFGHERRGQIRNVDVQVQVLSEIREFVSIIEQHHDGVLESPILDSNKDFREAIEGISHHGSWASFKLAEIFEKSLGYEQFKIQDLGIDGRDPNSNDGPVSGLRWLYGRDNKYDTSIFPVWNRFGANLAKAWGVDIGEIETCLCKWHKIMTGKYFIGHDIQEFVELEEVMGTNTYYELMKKNFDVRFWVDVKELQKSKKKVYQETDDILYSSFAKSLPQIDVYKILMETK